MLGSSVIHTSKKINANLTATNKGADQTARMRRLICAFVVRQRLKEGFLMTRFCNRFIVMSPVSMYGCTTLVSQGVSISYSIKSISILFILFMFRLHSNRRTRKPD